VEPPASLPRATGAAASDEAETSGAVKPVLFACWCLSALLAGICATLGFALQTFSRTLPADHTNYKSQGICNLKEQRERCFSSCPHRQAEVTLLPKDAEISVQGWCGWAEASSQHSWGKKKKKRKQQKVPKPRNSFLDGSRCVADFIPRSHH